MHVLGRVERKRRLVGLVVGVEAGVGDGSWVGLGVAEGRKRSLVGGSDGDGDARRRVGIR